MSRKARLTQKDLDLLAKAAIDCTGETAETVLARYIELEGRTISISTVEKKLAEWRRNKTISPAKVTLPTEERPLGLEAPWSLGVSAQPKYGITPESTGDLLAVWNYGLAIGHVFTIREARWVARLRGSLASFRRRRIGLLFAFSREYALRERICEILNKQMDTSDLDGELGINDRERFVYRALGLIPRWEPVYLRGESQYPMTLKHMSFADSVATNIATQNVPKAVYNRGYTDDLQEVFTYTSNLPDEQDRIYAALLLFLSKGPKWDTLSTQEYLLVLSELRKWVTEVISSKQPLEYERLDEKGGIKPTDILDPAFLEVVGYGVSIETTKKEAHHERSHSQEG